MGVPPVETTLELAMTRLSAKGNGPSSVDNLEARKASPRFPTQDEAQARLRRDRWRVVRWALAVALIVGLAYLIAHT